MRDYGDLYWLLIFGVGGLAKLGQWIRDRSRKSESLPAKKGERPAPARRASSAPPARAFRPPQAPAAKPFPMRDRLETTATPIAKPAVGPTHLATRSAEYGPGPSHPIAQPMPATPARAASRRPDAKRTVSPIAGTTHVSPGPRRSARKRRPRKPQQAGAEAVTQIARLMQSRGPESEPPPPHEPEELQGYGLNNLSIHELRRAVVLREVLDPPLALRKPDAGRW